jgi:hypothetical protein
MYLDQLAIEAIQKRRREIEAELVERQHDRTGQYHEAANSSLRM